MSKRNREKRAHNAKPSAGADAAHNFHDLAAFAHEMKAQFPDVWERVNVRYFDVPNGYHGFQAVAAVMTFAAGTALSHGTTNGMAAVASALAEHQFPTYYVGAELVASQQRTHPPKDMTWEDVPLPFDAMVFMLPDGALPFEKGHVTMMGFFRTRDVLEMPVPGHPTTTARVSPNRMIVFWAIDHCEKVYISIFPIATALEYDPEWMDRETIHHGPIQYSSTDGSRMCGLVANFLLVMAVRKDLIEASQDTGRIALKSRVPVHRPPFIGRTFKIYINRERRRAPSGAL